MAAVTNYVGKIPVKYGIVSPESNSGAIKFQFNENSVGIDLSGYTFIAQMRKKHALTPVWTFTVDTTNAATGELIVNMPADTTRPGTGVWDLVAYSGTSVTTLAEGPVVMKPSVSRIP